MRSLLNLDQLSSHQPGLLMTTIGVLILTPDALLLRLVEVDHWTLLFWRSLFACISLFAVNAYITGQGPIKAIRRLSLAGLLCVLLFTISNISFLLSITNTKVANTLVILASMPFIAALLTVALTRKNLPLRLWTTISIAMLGILIVFWGRLGSGSLFGDISALISALALAVTFVTVSLRSDINTLAAIGMASLLAALISLFMGARPATPSASDFAYIALNGGFIIPVAFGLITYGPKLLPAAEVSLIMLLETILGPIWVWLVLHEQPPQATLWGGSLVLGAVIFNAWLGTRSTSNRSASSS